MKVSRAWLQKYFDADLPSSDALADALTFHAFEIEEVSGDMLDVKVLPDRAGYALSHRGVAYELSAILKIPMKQDPLREIVAAFPSGTGLSVEVDETYVLRHTGALVKNVTVGPSPAWLKDALEAVGQRSINNVVDVLNYVMLDMGQPSGAFDLSVVTPENGTYKIVVRRAKPGEKIKVLTGETHELTDDMWAFADAVSGELLDVAGIKGGFSSGVNEKTQDIFITVGNYDGTLLRRASQKLKLFTDASLRFQNRPSPELTAFGMRGILALLKEVAGGEVVSVVDTYPKKPEPRAVCVSAADISGRLGMPYPESDIEDVFKRLDLPFSKENGTYVVTPPFERTDLVIPEDISEEVGRIVGYDVLPERVFEKGATKPDQARFKGIERMKDQLVEKGFTEVSTQSFVKKGDLMLANPLDKSRPALRTSLEATLGEALTRAKLNAPLALPPNQKPKLFEVGTVFPKAGEYVELRMTETAWEGVPTYDNLSKAKLEDYGKDYAPQRPELGVYTPFSLYPFIVRDIAFWVPEGASLGDAEGVIRNSAGPLAKRIVVFDTFSKDGRTSYGFRIVFQSDERTLTDEEANGYMKAVSDAVAAQGWEVR